MTKLPLKPWTLITGLLLLNFGIRLVIYYNTQLFSFSDYSAYLGGVDNIAAGEKQYLLIGNFLFMISYLGYFAREILGNLDWFFIFNCLLGSLTGLIIYYLVVRITGLKSAGIITLLILTFYTEFMVFSSVFYTAVLMIFLISLIILLLWYYITSKKRVVIFFSAGGIVLLFLLTFFFKPELKYLPWLFLLTGACFLRRNRSFSLKSLLLSFILFTFSFLFQNSGLITHPEGNVISNSFVFFGHTDYGGDGGEGSFVYPANKARYENALTEYCKVNNIVSPTAIDYNSFQREEMKRFITNHPLKWIRLQFTKFFRTFGVVPETTSFKVLYTGLLKENLWLTSFVVVVPIVMIILMFILFFPQCPVPCALRPETKMFLYIYILLSLYYLIATIFYGQYQERYRMPLMVVFLIPTLAYFISTFDRTRIFIKSSLPVKVVLIFLFFTIWTLQAERAISNKERLENAIESVRGSLNK
jgi:hypothetical protein